MAGLENASPIKQRLSVRLAVAADAAEIARVHVASWREAYRDLLSADYLAALSVEEREARWRSRIVASGTAGIWLGEVDARVAGFASVGASRDLEAPPGTAELHALYVAAQFWGVGLGRMLVSASVEDLRARSFCALTLWVFEANQRARRFYALAGFQPDGSRRLQPVGAVMLPEVRYGLRL